jgi:hypothetical protein
MQIQSQTLKALVETPVLFAPVLPRIGTLACMRCEDHATFAITPSSKSVILDYYAKRGLRPYPSILTLEFPAEHIALVYDPGTSQSCEDMIGLSVSDIADSPINKLADRYRRQGFDGVLQHIAYSVNLNANFAEVRQELEQQGTKFMTPILEYTDVNGATLRQMFVACTEPYGPFIEVVQRTKGNNGLLFQGFNASQIDDLYRHYDNYSRRLAGA